MQTVNVLLNRRYVLERYEIVFDGSAQIPGREIAEYTMWCQMLISGRGFTITSDYLVAHRRNVLEQEHESAYCGR